MKWVIISIVLALAVISFLIFVVVRNPAENLSNLLGSEKKDAGNSQQDVSQEDEQTGDADSSTGSAGGGGGGGGSSGGGGGGGGGGSSGGAGDSTQQCSTQQISYSLYKFNKKETCLVYQNNLCVEKTLACSASVQNLDYSITGEFQIDFILKDSSTNQILQQETLALTIEPRQEKKFENTFQVTGSDAEKELTCNIFSRKIPTKIVC